MKKLVSILLVLILAVCFGLAMTSCGGEDGPCTEHVDADDNGLCDKCGSSMITPSGKTELDVTLTVKDHEGATVSGVTVTLTERGAINSEGAVSAVSGADGKLTAKLRSSSTYLVSVDYDPDAIGFYSLTTTEIAVTESSTAFDIIMENKTPNGSESRPYNLSVENNALTIPAGKTVYYVLYRAMNLMASVTGSDIKIEYEGTEYTPDADGKISFPFIGTDMNYVATVKITSTGAADSEIDFLIEAFPGTLGNPYEIETDDLGEEISNTGVTKGETVYYTFKAETAGTLTLTVTSADTHAAMQNNSYQVSTSSEGTMTISLEVAAGDEVSINLTSSADENAVISFTLTVE